MSKSLAYPPKDPEATILNPALKYKRIALWLHVCVCNHTSQSPSNCFIKDKQWATNAHPKPIR